MNKLESLSISKSGHVKMTGAFKNFLKTSKVKSQITNKPIKKLGVFLTTSPNFNGFIIIPTWNLKK